MGKWGKLISLGSNLLWKYLMKRVAWKLYRIHKSMFFQFMSMKRCILLCYLDIIAFIVEQALVFNNLLIVFIFIFYEQLGVTILTRRFDDAVVSVPIKKGEIYIVLVPFMYTCIPNTNFSIVIIFYINWYLFSSLWRIVIYK